MRHVAEHADAVVEVDEHRAAFGHVLAAVIGHARRTKSTAAAIDEDDHRPLVARFRLRRRPQVQIEAVLAGRLFTEIVVDVVGAQHLDAFRPLAIGIPDPVPLDRLRRLPAQFAGRRLGEGNAEIGLHARAEPGAGNLAAGDRQGITSDRHHRIGENPCGGGEQRARQRNRADRRSREAHGAFSLCFSRRIYSVNRSRHCLRRTIADLHPGTMTGTFTTPNIMLFSDGALPPSRSIRIVVLG